MRFYLFNITFHPFFKATNGLAQATSQLRKALRTKDKENND